MANTSGLSKYSFFVLVSKLQIIYFNNSRTERKSNDIEQGWLCKANNSLLQLNTQEYTDVACVCEQFFSSFWLKRMYTILLYVTANRQDVDRDLNQKKLGANFKIFPKLHLKLVDQPTHNFLASDSSIPQI